MNVASVGDGGCSAILAGGGARPAVIIDCGSQSGAERAVAGLDRIVDLPRQPSPTIVVTHLHRDHYNGFRRLGSVVGRKRAFARATLVQPMIPLRPAVAPFTARFLALQMYLGEVSGIPDLDFADSLRRSCRYDLVRRPISAGEQFEAGGHTFDVLWPPRDPTATMSTAVRRAVEAFESLASRDRRIEENLDLVRRSGLVDADPDSEISPLPGAYEEQVDVDGEDLETGEQDGSPVHLGASVSADRRRYSDSLAGEIREAAAAFGKAANHMSLVFATPRRDFVAWGDVGLPLARRIAGENPPRSGLAPRSMIALAPHHGSHAGAPSFGETSRLCISQNGERLYPLWHPGHRPCAADLCVSTHELGDILLR